MWTFDEFQVWWNDFQDLELGIGGTARLPVKGSIAERIQQGGGDVKALMRLDFAVEAAALRCLGSNSAGDKTLLTDTINAAKQYVLLYVAEEERRACEDSLDRLLISI